MPIESAYGERSDSPTLGQSTTHIRISQPRASSKGMVTLPVVYPPILPKSSVTTIKPHFSNTTIETSSCPSSPRNEENEADLASYNYDYTSLGVLDKEIQAPCNHWNSGTESSTTPDSSKYTTDKSREQVLLHPAPKAKGYIKCFRGPPSPMRLAESSPVASPQNLTFSPRQSSQKGAISGIYQHAESQNARRFLDRFQQP